jgi:hypothetical protein
MLTQNSGLGARQRAEFVLPANFVPPVSAFVVAPRRFLSFLPDGPVSFQINHRMTKPIATVAKANQAPFILLPFTSQFYDALNPLIFISSNIRAG